MSEEQPETEKHARTTVAMVSAKIDETVVRIEAMEKLIDGLKLLPGDNPLGTENAENIDELGKELDHRIGDLVSRISTLENKLLSQGSVIDKLSADMVSLRDAVNSLAQKIWTPPPAFYPPPKPVKKRWF